jgi:hypothetical protein
MQIILLDKVVNLGNLGEIVKVKDGYARNFLIPHGPARRATEANKAEFEAKRAELEKAAAAKLAESQAQGEKLGRHDRQADAKGRRRRPPVRLGHQRRHRRRADQARLPRRQGANAHAQRPDQDRWRQHRDRGPAHRRGRRHHRHRVRRNRLSVFSLRCKKPPSGGFFLAGHGAPAVRKVFQGLHRKITVYSQPCPQHAFARAA